MVLSRVAPGAHRVQSRVSAFDANLAFVLDDGRGGLRGGRRGRRRRPAGAAGDPPDVQEARGRFRESRHDSEGERIISCELRWIRAVEELAKRADFVSRMPECIRNLTESSDRLKAETERNLLLDYVVGLHRQKPTEFIQFVAIF